VVITASVSRRYVAIAVRSATVATTAVATAARIGDRTDDQTAAEWDIKRRVWLSVRLRPPLVEDHR
jgi:hypothetical protein